MAKHRVVCPECGHRHTINVPGRQVITAGVRAKRITGRQFEYNLTVPQAMVEAERFTTVTDDLLLAGAVGAAVGAVVGFGVSPFAGDYALHVIGAGVSGGTALAWGWLCAEHNTRLKRVLPWFVEQRAAWRAVDTPTNEGVSLTVDHRYRDGATEAGRTINYFGTLPVDVERFNEYCKMALRGDSLAIGQLTGQGKLFTKQEYLALLAILQPAGVIVDLGGNKGNTLTGVGRRLLKRHLEQEVL